MHACICCSYLPTTGAPTVLALFILHFIHHVTREEHCAAAHRAIVVSLWRQPRVVIATETSGQHKHG
jgi:hypothetical protein